MCCNFLATAKHLGSELDTYRGLPCELPRQQVCLFITVHSCGLRVLQDVIKFHEGV